MSWPGRPRAPPGAVSAIPLPIQAQEDDEFRPVALVLAGRSQAVASVDGWCEVEEDWWKDNPVVRMYYRVTLKDGQQ